MRLVPVARIGKPRGFKGEVWVHPYREGFPLLTAGDEVWIGEGPDARKAVVKEYFSYAKGTVLHLEGFGGEKEALAASGHELCLPSEMVPEEGEGTFDTEEVVGWEVEDKNRGRVGRVRAVRPGPAYWTFLAESPAGEFEVPAVRGLGVRLDKERKILSTDLPPGYPGVPGEDDAV